VSQRSGIHGLPNWYLNGYLYLVDIFGALADPVRRSLLGDLGDGPRRVVDLAAGRSISRPAVSKHLRLLLDTGAVTVTDRGRERVYTLDRSALEPVAAYVAGLTARPIDGQALDALETEVRRTGRERRRTAPEEHEETA
jgi:DNA-binding transcriptional ArsR family regulator